MNFAISSNPADLLDTPEHAEHAALAARKGNDLASKLARAKGSTWLADRGLASLLERPDRPALKVVGEAPPAVSQGNPKPGSTPALPVVNHAAEHGCLAAALVDNASLDGPLAELVPEHFYDRTRRVVFETMRDLHATGNPFDSAILLDALVKSGRLPSAEAATAVSHLAGNPPREKLVARHAEIVRADAERRAAALAAESLLREAGAGRIKPGDLSDRLRGLIERIDPQTTADATADGAFRPWPAPPGPAAWQGVAGDLVSEIAPRTEADPVAILGQFLVSFGSVLGRSAHWTVDASRHYCNLYLVIAGQSSRGRKGTAWEICRNLTGFLDTDWRKHSIRSGLNSGEGLLYAIRDESMATGDYDPGVEDKRALWIESEFSATIGVMNREGNSLSGYLRKGWDGDDMTSASKNCPVSVTRPHISVIGHTTFAELSRRLNATESLNGFANRFLWVCARRSRELPEGGDLLSLDLDRYRNKVARALAWSLKRGEVAVPFDGDARELWHASYAELSRPRAGKLGPVTDRAEAQVRRLAVIYATLDKSPHVGAAHLQAALEFWGYCERSAAYIFGDAEGDPAAEKIVTGLRAAGEKGLTRNEINRTLFRGKGSATVDGALTSLISAGLVDVREVRNGRAKSTVFTLSTVVQNLDPARSLRSSGCHTRSSSGA